MLTAIQKFYANSTILVTGATGYLGTYFVEKLLRSCPDVKKVYLLVRKKRGRPNEDRLVEFFESPVYNALKRSNPRAFQTVEVLSGDLELEELGLGDGDQEKVANEVNSVFHVGATINMAETLRMSTLSAAPEGCVADGDSSLNMNCYSRLSMSPLPTPSYNCMKLMKSSPQAPKMPIT
ncbi:hypothetical protein PPYR_12784 [Photinus pyralis]|uniref:Fatty acyl-CoA reductase n=1 Tax=Photinus pyralis TaxID=7054 RepID=A0A5N4A1J5_PHOPY|nr:hypothetical protein PPYR_03000 [Photinus pyralis]KAB0793164.1 hypothetical protein PPYR_12784 [Photinus pyralis]